MSPPPLIRPLGRSRLPRAFPTSEHSGMGWRCGACCPRQGRSCFGCSCPLTLSRWLVCCSDATTVHRSCWARLVRDGRAITDLLSSRVSELGLGTSRLALTAKLPSVNNSATDLASGFPSERSGKGTGPVTFKREGHSRSIAVNSCVCRILA